MDRQALWFSSLSRALAGQVSSVTAGSATVERCGEEKNAVGQGVISLLRWKRKRKKASFFFTTPLRDGLPLRASAPTKARRRELERVKSRPTSSGSAKPKTTREAKKLLYRTRCPATLLLLANRTPSRGTTVKNVSHGGDEAAEAPKTSRLQARQGHVFG